MAGALESGDCLRPGGAYQDSYELVLANDTTVQIDVKSTAFDAYLVLKDENGAVIEEDDDGGSVPNARIVRLLTAGTYEIVASAFRQGQIGTYDVSVDAPAPLAADSHGLNNVEVSAGKARLERTDVSELIERLMDEYRRRRAEQGGQRWLIR